MLKSKENKQIKIISGVVLTFFCLIMFATTINPVYAASNTIKLKATLYGNDDVKLTWKKQSKIDGYRVMYKKALSKSYTHKGYYKNSVTSVKFANLADGLTYTFKVTPYTLKNNKKVYKSSSYVSIRTINLQVIAKNAKINNSTQPCKSGFSAAWVSGVYEKSGYGYPGGNAIDFWTKWKSGGSKSTKNIPVGAVVVGSGTKTSGKNYGHVGIYIGNGKVVDNVGKHRIISLKKWINAQVGTCQGHTGWIGWVIPNVY